MLFSSSVIQYSFHLLLVCYHLNILIEVAIAQGTKENFTSSVEITRTTTTTSTKLVVVATVEAGSNTTAYSLNSMRTTSTSAVVPQADDGGDISLLSTSRAPSATPLSSTTNSDAILSTTQIVIVSGAQTILTQTNSTKPAYRAKSSLPIILAAAFGGLVLIALISSIIMYVLIKQGYITAFNQPRTRMKEIERTRIVGSSSSVRGTSPSRR